MGGGGSLEIFRKIKELELKVIQLETENQNKLSTNPQYITKVPSGTKVQFFSADADINIATGKIPTYSKGIYIPSRSASDAVLIAVDIVGGNKLITAIKVNGAWQNIRII